MISTNFSVISVTSTNYSVPSERTSTVRPKLHRQRRSTVAYYRASNSCWVDISQEIARSGSTATPRQLERVTVPTGPDITEQQPFKPSMMLRALRVSQAQQLSRPQHPEGCRRDLASGTLGSPTPPFSVKPPCPSCLRVEAMVQCRAWRSRCAYSSMATAPTPRNSAANASATVPKTIRLKALRPMSNHKLLLTNPDAAQSVASAPLCLLSGLAAQAHVGLTGKPRY